MISSIRHAATLLLLTILVGGTVDLRAAEPSSSTRPDIIFYLLDAARADYFGIYGQKDPTTPGIDAIAKQGTVFRRHYANSFNTRYSLSHIFTSRYEAFPILNYIDDPDYPWWIRDEVLPADVALLPTLLKDAGYRTVMVTAHSFTAPETELGRAFGEVVQIPPRDNQPSAPAEDVFRAANRVVEQHAAQKPRRPLFLYVHLLDTHMPHDHSAVDEGFVKGAAKKWSDAEKKKRRPKMQANAHDSLDPAGVELIRGEAKGAYAYLDRHLSAFHAQARKALGATPVTILTADHGDAYGEQKFIGHNYGTFGMEELHHIPLIMHGPGIPKGRTVSEFSSLIDILPTILDVAGGERRRRQRIDGDSLLLPLRGKSLGRSGVPLVFRVAWKASRLGFRDDSGTWVVTERDEVYRLKTGASAFEHLGLWSKAKGPRELADFVRRYRQREEMRSVEARGRIMNVPVTDFLREGPGACWSEPDWRTWQGSIRFRPGKNCDALRFAIDYPDGVYHGSWNVSMAGPGKGAVIRIQTSGSSEPIEVDSSVMRTGSIDLGRVSVRKGRLDLYVRSLQEVGFDLSSIRFDRMDRSLPGDEKLSPEERERLRSLGYIQ